MLKLPTSTTATSGTIASPSTKSIPRLGFRTEITLDEGIRELYEWIKPNHTIDLSAAPQFNNQAMIREFAQSAAAQQSTLRMLQSLSECA